MRVPRHWIRETADVTDSRGRTHRGEGWGWSETAVEEARQRAKAVAEKVAAWLARGDLRFHRDDAGAPPASAQYLYHLDRPPREEIVQELHDAAGDATALITRSIYGALILNSAELMFVDVDFPPPPRPTLGGMLKRLFGGAAPPPADPAEEVIERTRAWCSAHASLGPRLYRTAAGLRVAISGQPLQARGPDSQRILEELGSDPLYRRLCDVQECFRARLSPKPWRIECGQPPARFPFADAVKEQAYRQWQRGYEAAAVNFATCELLDVYGGDGDAHPGVASLLNLHDGLTGVGKSLPLA